MDRVRKDLAVDLIRVHYVLGEQGILPGHRKGGDTGSYDTLAVLRDEHAELWDYAAFAFANANFKKYKV